MNTTSVRMVLSILLLFPFMLSCQEQSSTTSSTPAAPVADSTQPVAHTPEDKPARESTRFTWHLIRTKDSAGKRELKSLTKEQTTILYAVNRVDASAARVQDTLVVPDQWENDLMAYSPYPLEVPQLADVHKIIFFSYPIQAFGVYESGKLVRWGPTSMGKKSTQTPIGLFFSNWKAKETISTVNDEWKLKFYFNVHNKEGVSWHQYAMPGYPASHACMRLLMHDAVWLYDWADQWRLSADRNTVVLNGTPVVIFGEYDWAHPKPWRKMAADANATTITVEALNAEFAEFLPKIREEQARRDAGIPATPPAAAAATDPAPAETAAN